MTVHVRFAPSPTGSLHLGSALTALVNRLFASKQGGTMLLRIDDTDAERTVPGAEDAILADLEWLGIGWDDGPIRQSSRAERHVEAANTARDTSIRDGALYLAPPGVRPFVIVRGDGRPTYHWATVVDDLDFGITHVIRGGDHRANEDLHTAGFRALGAEPPVFIHHAVVLGGSGKLSKREGDASVADLRTAGYLPAAVVNMLGLVASSGPGELLDMDELVARFDPDRIARGDVRLDPARLRSLSALQMYHRATRRPVEGTATLRFLLLDDAFPRSFTCCLNDVVESLRRLPHPDVVLLSCDEARRLLAAVEMDELDGDDLHELADRLQVAIGAIHDRVISTYVRTPAGH